MLRLFKNLRGDSLGKNKVIKYLVYAFGEIILVVIGILIAVQIDNSNENRKKLEAFQEIVNEIEENLTADIEQYDFLLKQHYLKDSIMKRVLTGDLTEAEYRKNWRELRSLISACITFYMHKNGFTALQKILEDVPNEYKPIVKDLTDYYLYDAEGAYDVSMREDRLVWKTIEDWEDKYDWYSLSKLDTTINSGYLNYLLKSPEYRNKVTTYLINTQNLISTYESSRYTGLDILLRLKRFDGFEPNSALPDFMEILTVGDTTRSSPCSSEIEKKAFDRGSQIKSIVLIHNRSATNIKAFGYSNPDGSLDKEDYVEIAPGDLGIMENINKTMFRIVNSKNECMGQFVTGKQNMLVEISQ
jgi:hypothetical protein